jgi:chemotaxis protein MotB
MFWQDYHQRKRASDMYDPLGFSGGIRQGRKSKGGEEDNANWIFTYSDMVTLLLAFFIIVASVSVPDPDKYKKVQESLASTIGEKYLAVQLPKNIRVLPNKAPALALAPPVPLDKDTAAKSEAEGQAGKSESEVTQELPPDMVNMSVIMTALKNVIEDQGLAEQVHITRVKNSATISFPEGVFFSSGAAVVSPQAKPFLKKVAVALAAIKTPFVIEVEGHTDNRPIILNRKAYPTNWELSTARATQVVRYFLDHGVKPQQLVAKGYADTKPLAPNLDSRGKPIAENQKVNRRVVLRIIAAEDGGQ